MIGQADGRGSSPPVCVYKSPQENSSGGSFKRRYAYGKEGDPLNENTEIWKYVPGYEGKYVVSNMGRVKSLERKVRSVNWYTGKEFFRTVKERILKPGPSNSGHLSVVLGHGEAGKQVHQLVMKAFVGDPPEGMEVRHLNGDPTDNRLENLEYGTRTENILDVYYQGGRWRKLNLNDVLYARFAAFCEIPDHVIASELNVAPSTIANIRKGKSYQWAK